MFKKSLSMFLCIVMCISFFSMTVTETLAAYDMQSIFTVTGEPINGDELNYSISVAKGQEGIGGIVLVVEYDSNVLEPVEDYCVPAKKGSSQNFIGVFENGVSATAENLYVIAYMNYDGVSTANNALGFFNMKFKVVDSSRPKTSVRFYCKEYYSLTEPHKNITSSNAPQLIDEFVDIPTLSKPVLKGVEYSENGIKVLWNPVEGALGYQIIRTSPHSTWESVGEVSAEETSFVDTALISGDVYTYSVRAFNNSSVSFYDPIGVTTKYIEKPVITSVNNVVDGVEINWNEIVGAETYIVLRRVAGESQWREISRKTYTAGTSYKDTTVSDGVTYEYDVNSAADNIVTTSSETGMGITYIAVPEIESFTNIHEGIKIEWALRDDATHYIVYRKNIGVDANFVQYSVEAANYFVDRETLPGRTYSYAVQVFTNSGESAYSLTGHSITRVPPTRVTSLSLEKDGVNIKWESVDNVTGYAIYRKAVSETMWSQQYLVKVGSNVTSYIDKTANSGGEYVYAVCPVIASFEGAKTESSSIYFIKAPGNVAAENILDGIKIKWESVLGATEYEVMRTDSEGEQRVLARVNAGNACECIDRDVQMGSTYSYTVKAISPRSNSLVSEQISFMRIGAMGKATPAITTGGIKVTWDTVDFAESYAVFRSSGGEWSQITTVTEPEYIDANVKSGETYSYAVAIVIDGSVGIYETEDAIELKYIAPPENVVATNGVDFVKLVWPAVAGATGYKVYLVDNNSRRLVATVDSNTCTYSHKQVASGETYNFVVRSVSDEKTSEDSRVVTKMFLGTPVISKITNEFKGVKITWKSVKGAQSYYIYSKSKDDKKWSCIDTVDADKLTYTHTGATDGKTTYYAVKAVNGDYTSSFESHSIKYIAAPEVTLNNKQKGVQIKWKANENAKTYRVYRKAGKDKNWSLIANVNTTEYVDTKAKSGVDYKYTVQIHDGKTYSGYNTDGWAIRFLNAPKMKSVANGYGFVKVTWEKVAGAKGYKIYRKYTTSDNWSCIGETTKLYYKDKKVSNKASYNYRVKAYYGDKTSGYYSGKSIKYLAAPTVSVENRVEGVQVNWDRVSGASSYYVYRKAGSAKTWKKIATVSKTIYIDTKVKSGTTYKYMVKAYGSKTTSGYNTDGWKIVYLSAPKIVSAKSYKAGITVKWKSVNKASGYFIFRKTGKGIWEQVGKVEGNKKLQYRDKTAEYGYKYTYTVRAYYGKYRSWFHPGITCVDQY